MTTDAQIINKAAKAYIDNYVKHALLDAGVLANKGYPQNARAKVKAAERMAGKLTTEQTARVVRFSLEYATRDAYHLDKARASYALAKEYAPGLTAEQIAPLVESLLKKSVLGCDTNHEAAWKYLHFVEEIAGELPVAQTVDIVVKTAYAKGADYANRCIGDRAENCRKFVGDVAAKLPAHATEKEALNIIKTSFKNAEQRARNAVSGDVARASLTFIGNIAATLPAEDVKDIKTAGLNAVLVAAGQTVLLDMQKGWFDLAEDKLKLAEDVTAMLPAQAPRDISAENLRRIFENARYAKRPVDFGIVRGAAGLAFAQNAAKKKQAPKTLLAQFVASAKKTLSAVRPGSARKNMKFVG